MIWKMRESKQFSPGYLKSQNSSVAEAGLTSRPAGGCYVTLPPRLLDEQDPQKGTKLDY